MQSVTTLEVSAIDMCAMTHAKNSPIIEIKNDETLELADDLLLLNNTQPAKNSSPVEESENKKLLEMSNTKIAPIHQDKAALLDLISCAEELMVVTSVSAGTEKDTSSEVTNSTKDLKLSVVEKKASSLYESDKSSQIVQIPEVEENDTILAISTINIAK